MNFGAVSLTFSNAIQPWFNLRDGFAATTTSPGPSGPDFDNSILRASISNANFESKFRRPLTAKVGFEHPWLPCCFVRAGSSCHFEPSASPDHARAAISTFYSSQAGSRSHFEHHCVSRGRLERPFRKAISNAAGFEHSWHRVGRLELPFRAFCIFRPFSSCHVEPQSHSRLAGPFRAIWVPWDKPTRPFGAVCGSGQARAGTSSRASRSKSVKLVGSFKFFSVMLLRRQTFV